MDLWGNGREILHPMELYHGIIKSVNKFKQSLLGGSFGSIDFYLTIHSEGNVWDKAEAC